MLDCNNNTDGLWGCGYYASLPYGYDYNNGNTVDRRGLAQLPFYKGNFEFIEREVDRGNELYVDDVYGNYDNENYVDEENFKRIKTRKQTLPVINPNKKKTILKTKRKKISTQKKQKVPYKGYQHPDEIDWSQYGPDRPTKKKMKKKEYVTSSTSFENSIVAKFSFFGLLLPGILGTLFFLGVPIAKVYLAGASLVTMYFMTGQGKALEDKSLMTSVLLNILEFLDTLTYDEKARHLLSHSPMCFNQLSLEKEISDLMCDEDFLPMIRKPPMLALARSCKTGDIKRMIARLVHTLAKLFGECQFK